MQIDEATLIEQIEQRIKEITDTMTPDMQPMVKLLQSTRARVLIDIVDIIKNCAIVEK
jgi:hypothetical protein